MNFLRSWPFWSNFDSNSAPFLNAKNSYFSFDAAGIWWSKHNFSTLGLPVTNQGSLLLTKQTRWNLLFPCFFTWFYQKLQLTPTNRIFLKWVDDFGSISMKKWTLGISLSMLKILKDDRRRRQKNWQFLSPTSNNFGNKCGVVKSATSLMVTDLEVVCVGDKFWMFVTD